MDIVCISHLRWNFVFQRPQHLLSRAARDSRVLYFEEPVVDDGPSRVVLTTDTSGVTVAVPHLESHLSATAAIDDQRRLLTEAVATTVGLDYILWYYTPMALPFTDGLRPRVVVFDCMDELSLFAGAPAELRSLERALLKQADVVFTGGRSLYEAKRTQHHNIHAMPSSVDIAHFRVARTAVAEPPDQLDIPHVRLGFFGVLDERIDYPLIQGLADARPDWHQVLVGPTAKIDPTMMPQAPNIHYLGPKSYGELPAYIAGWDVAVLPFARNGATRFISPTKTPEYLAAGRPVVSTSIRDVVRPYGQRGLARIADTVDDFVIAVEASLREDRVESLRAADAFLLHLSWDKTWSRMRRVIGEVRENRSAGRHSARPNVTAIREELPTSLARYPLGNNG
jgi:glycosyltransferase involved in cell wall biosynthesis